MLCGGLLWKAKLAGKRIGVIDLTRGELGTRGSIATRKLEAAAATRSIGLNVRENLGLRDGGLLDDARLRPVLVRAMRKHRPACVLAPHWEDQHPDHAAVGQAIGHAAFLAGVPNFDPRSARGVASADALPYRPKQIWHYNNRYGIAANLVVDVTMCSRRRWNWWLAFRRNLAPVKRAEKRSRTNRRLSCHENFLEWLRGWHTFYGYQIGAKYGEAYCVKGRCARMFRCWHE